MGGLHLYCALNDALSDAMVLNATTIRCHLPARGGLAMVGSQSSPSGLRSLNLTIASATNVLSSGGIQV